MRILVTGAAGFIGSTTSEMLLDDGYEVVALDNLSRGRRENVPARATFVEGDCGDMDLIASLGAFDACVHFAARIEPADSMVTPEVFFDNNVGATFRLLRALVENGTRKFVFSSSCAVYGDRVTIPIGEDHPTAPHSPYGLSKLMVEQGDNMHIVRIKNTLDLPLDIRAGCRVLTRRHTVKSVSWYNKTMNLSNF